MIPIVLAVLAAIVLCIVNLIRRRLFVLFLSLPIWLALGMHVAIVLCCGGSSPNRLIGYPELVLALMLTLTLTGKRQPTIPNPENNPLSDSIGDNTGTRSE